MLRYTQLFALFLLASFVLFEVTGAPQKVDEVEDDEEESDERAERDEPQEPAESELIPIASVRKARGNGADLQDFANEVVEEVLIEEQREMREEAHCLTDHHSCQENKECCSGFCSWTHGFECQTIGHGDHWNR